MYKVKLDHIIKGQGCKLNTENWEGGAYGWKEGIPFLTFQTVIWK